MHPTGRAITSKFGIAKKPAVGASLYGRVRLSLTGGQCQKGAGYRLFFEMPPEDAMALPDGPHQGEAKRFCYTRLHPPLSRKDLHSKWP